jgi:hypothetical protein
MNIYNKALKKILDDDTPPPTTALTRAELKAEIANISKQLQGPLSNTERLCLVEDRQVLRKQLAATPTPDGEG